MHLFHPANAPERDISKIVYARYELAYTLVDFLSAILFFVGSILFFWADTTFSATWLFVIGSVCFGIKPGLRFAREYHMYRLEKYDPLVQRELNEI